LSSFCIGNGLFNRDRYGWKANNLLRLLLVNSFKTPISTRSSTLGLKNRQVGEKWVSDDCSYLCKGLLYAVDASR
jgi:hypothetical protein